MALYLQSQFCDSRSVTRVTGLKRYCPSGSHLALQNSIGEQCYRFENVGMNHACHMAKPFGGR